MNLPTRNYLEGMVGRDGIDPEEGEDAASDPDTIKAEKTMAAA